MIRYALICADCEAGFEAWFRSSGAYDQQVANGRVNCPACDSARVTKQIMAPAVRSSKAPKGEPDTAELLAAARDHIASTHDYVGTEFPDEARAMHYGDIDTRPIWGEASATESEALRDEGIAAVQLPKPLAPTPPKDKSKLN